MKSKLTLSVDKDIVESAKNMNMNISEEIETVLKEKVTRGSSTFLEVEGYTISFDARNWIVSGKKDSSDNTYHTSLGQALINLSTRILKDELKSKDKILSIGELINVVNDHHKYIINLVRGM